MKVFVPSNVMVLSLHTLYWRQPDLVPRTTDEVWYLVTVQLLIASILYTTMFKCILVSKYNTHFLLTSLVHTTTKVFLSLSFFEIIHDLIYFLVNFHPTPLSSFLRYNHDQQYSIPFAHTNHFKYSFLPNSISVWNNLPLEAVHCTTLPMFKYYTLPLFL